MVTLNIVNAIFTHENNYFYNSKNHVLVLSTQQTVKQLQNQSLDVFIEYQNLCLQLGVGGLSAEAVFFFNN